MALTSAVLVLVASTPAHAHLVTTGLGPFYDGITHFALSPVDIAVTAALAALAAMRGRATGRIALAVLPSSFLAGGVAGLLGGHASSGWITCLLLILAGVLLAFDLRLRAPWIAVLVGATAAADGLQLASGDGAGASRVAGAVVAVVIVTTLVAGVVVSLEKPWTRIVVRVMGSWIAAVGLLMLGWQIRGR